MKDLRNSHYVCPRSFPLAKPGTPGVTHIAHGAVRLHRTHVMIGEAIGMAASLCKEHSTLPRDLHEKHLDELKELMQRCVGNHDLVSK